jgi:hypothetical protein
MMKNKNMIRNNLNSLSGSEKIESNHWQSAQSGPGNLGNQNFSFSLLGQNTEKNQLARAIRRFLVFWLYYHNFSMKGQLFFIKIISGKSSTNSDLSTHFLRSLCFLQLTTHGTTLYRQNLSDGYRFTNSFKGRRLSLESFSLVIFRKKSSTRNI